MQISCHHTSVRIALKQIATGYSPRHYMVMCTGNRKPYFRGHSNHIIKQLTPGKFIHLI